MSGGKRFTGVTRWRGMRGDRLKLKLKRVADVGLKSEATVAL